jgi:AraC-like DNA-binding protein
MIFQEIKPSPILQELVRNYLIVNLESESKLPATRYPARIEQALVFFARGYIECSDPENKQKTRIARNAIFGQQISRLNFQSIAQGDFMMIMVIFQPGALHQFLKIPAYELSGNFCDAEQFIGYELKSVNDAIANTLDYKRMIDYVEQYLIAKSASRTFEKHRIDKIGKLLLDSPRNFSLDYLADQACFSPRQLERKFHQRFGIGPKVYQRISRFYKAFEFKEKNPTIDWLTIALKFGYTDYYHLVKDCNQFACVTPNILLHEYANRPEAVLINFMRESNL